MLRVRTPEGMYHVNFAELPSMSMTLAPEQVLLEQIHNLENQGLARWSKVYECWVLPTMTLHRLTIACLNIATDYSMKGAAILPRINDCRWFNRNL